MRLAPHRNRDQNPKFALPSPAADLIRRQIGLFATSLAPVLITGETGVGKDDIARTIHRRSGRRGGLVVINAATLRSDTATSELFGHEIGAFTGASRAYSGAIMSADQGTLFIDEVGELPESVQPMLLRALEQQAIRRLGGCREHPVDLRLVAATCCDLSQAVQAGAFREDLFHRLSVLTVHIPPLRQRKDDLEFLADKFRQQYAPDKNLSEASWSAIMAYDWPGNIRELRNAVQRASVLVAGKTLEPKDLWLPSECQAMPSLDELVRHAVRGRFIACQRNANRTADSLKLHRSTVYRYLKEDGL